MMYKPDDDASSSNNRQEEEEPTPAPHPLPLPYIPIGHPDTMMSQESVRRAVENFQTRPSDIIVATFAKTGTTLVLWMAHLLRTFAGDPNINTEQALDFEFLYDVVPWPLLSWDIGMDPNTATPSHLRPRVFKSHLRLASVYRGCKYVVTIRDPAKVGVSFYNFLHTAKQVPAVQGMDVNHFITETPFVQGREGRASLWEYYAEYHLARDCPSVLVLVYEDLAHPDKKKRCLRLLAKFMDLPDNAADNNQDLMDRVAAMSTKEFMAQYNSKFDEPYERALSLGTGGRLVAARPRQQGGRAESSFTNHHPPCEYVGLSAKAVATNDATVGIRQLRGLCQCLS